MWKKPCWSVLKGSCSPCKSWALPSCQYACIASRTCSRKVGKFERALHNFTRVPTALSQHHRPKCNTFISACFETFKIPGQRRFDSAHGMVTDALKDVRVVDASQLHELQHRQELRYGIWSAKWRIRAVAPDNRYVLVILLGLWTFQMVWSYFAGYLAQWWHLAWHGMLKN